MRCHGGALPAAAASAAAAGRGEAARRSLSPSLHTCHGMALQRLQLVAIVYAKVQPGAMRTLVGGARKERMRALLPSDAPWPPMPPHPHPRRGLVACLQPGARGRPSGGHHFSKGGCCWHAQCAAGGDAAG